MQIKEKLRLKIIDAVCQVANFNPHEIDKLISKPKKLSHGDLALPCFIFAKQWGCSPADSALQLQQRIKTPNGISHCEPAGPFLNFFFDRNSFCQEVIKETIVVQPRDADNKTVVIEYSSPNIAKPFHVGHLRATLIGNCLDRVYREIGWETISINHLGDWGTQFGFVWAGCKLWGTPQESSVTSLVELYRWATALRTEQEKGKNQELPNVNELANAYFLDLEKGEPYAKEFWQSCVEVSLEYLKRTYQRLNVTFDHYIGESFYSDKLHVIQQELEDSGLLVESQGAKGVDLGEQIGFARIFTPDGRSLYLTRDLAAAKYRAARFHYDRSIYVVGAPQTLHFQQLKGVLKALGRDYADSIVHVPFGHVLGMKTRGDGDFIELNEFLDEAQQKALAAYHNQVSKRPEGLDETEVARSVALSAIIFSNLSRSNIKDVHFSWDRALEFQGDSGPYLLYACARINGIKEKAEAAGIKTKLNIESAQCSEESAYLLASTLSDFTNILEKTAVDNEPCYLAAYALELAKNFSKAYNELKVLGEEKEKAEARLSLFEAVSKTLSKCLRLLGITPLERM